MRVQPIPEAVFNAMPRFQSRNDVRALKIKSLKASHVMVMTLDFEGYPSIEVDAGLAKRFNAKAGDYFVIYPEGEQWIVTEEQFGELFKPAAS